MCSTIEKQNQESKIFQLSKDNINYRKTKKTLKVFQSFEIQRKYIKKIFQSIKKALRVFQSFERRRKETKSM